METTFRDRLEENSGTGICCDIGHLILEGADISKVIHAYQDLIREFHFHDAVEWTLQDGKTILQDHVALGSGVLDVKDTRDNMLSHGFDGVLMIEVGRWEAAAESGRVVRVFEVVPHDHLVTGSDPPHLQFGDGVFHVLGSYPATREIFLAQGGFVQGTLNIKDR